MCSKKWWEIATFEKPLVCVYCGSETSQDEDAEHILPESFGNNETLYNGAVCTKCNNSLGTKVDGHIFKEPMIGAGLIGESVEGKRGTRTELGDAKREGSVLSIGGISGVPNEFYVARAFAKCSTNIVTHYWGSVAAREKCSELVNYVVSPKNREDIWPYAGIYTPRVGFPVTFGINPAQSKLGKYPIAIFSFASGIFGCCLDRCTPDSAKLAFDLVHEIAEPLMEVAAEEGHPMMKMPTMAGK